MPSHPPTPIPAPAGAVPPRRVRRAPSDRFSTARLAMLALLLGGALAGLTRRSAEWLS